MKRQERKKLEKGAAPHQRKMLLRYGLKAFETVATSNPLRAETCASGKSEGLRGLSIADLECER